MSVNEELVTGIMEVDSECSKSDSGDSSENEAALEEKAKDLESQIDKYPYSYDAHVELVGVYRILMDLTSMRKAYKRFSEHYPLTSSLWLNWIRNEIKIASSNNDKKYIIDLFDKAVQDYLSVELWLEYVQFSIGSVDPSETRQVFEKAINAVGLHVAKGSLIWDAYREFELAHLSCIVDSDSEQWIQQAKRIADIFRRQISVSLLDMDRTFVEWRVWYERLPKNDLIDKDQLANIEWSYKRSSKYLNEYKEFEDRLLSNENLLIVYREYIKYANMSNVKYDHQIEMIRCLYERAIAESSLDSSIWLDYCVYFFKLGNFPLCLSTSERALRNCPWSDDLWIFKMRALELMNNSHDDITECLEKALDSGLIHAHQYLQVWLAYLEHFKRITDIKEVEAVNKLRTAFENGNDYLSTNFGVDGDPECTILRLWAKIEANFLKNMTKARKIWNEYGILNIHGSKATFWLELVALEQQYGDEKHVLRTYQRALTMAKDWPQCVVQSWLMYEREHGTAESIITCINTCSPHLKKYESENVASTSGEQTYDDAKRKQSFEKGKKRKHDDEKPYYKTKQEKREKEKKSTSKLTNKMEIKEVEIKDETSKPLADWMDNERQSRSVFLSNLDYKVTEDDLKEFLGPTEKIRLVSDHKGNSKGYAYVIFSKSEEAEKTLKRDRERIDGRPVFISKCKLDRTQREIPFRFSTDIEKHKLFVRGLPKSMTKENVEELFKPYGELKEVRLVTYRNGYSKGLAYIEYVNSTDASKAVTATDNMDVQGYTISVAISAPPKRQHEDGPISTSLTHKQHDDATNVAPRHKQHELVHPERSKQSKRLQIPLVPRVLQTTAPKPATTLTNDDFRKMLLNEK